MKIDELPRKAATERERERERERESVCVCMHESLCAKRSMSSSLDSGFVLVVFALYLIFSSLLLFDLVQT